MPGIIARIIDAKPTSAMDVASELAVWYTSANKLSSRALAYVLQDLGISATMDQVEAAITRARAELAEEKLRQLENDWSGKTQ